VAESSVFRGNAPARVDEKGRLKVPGDFRAPLESKYGRELFVTSLTGEYVRIYPMPVWMEIEQKLGGMPSTHPSRVRFLERVNYYGQVGELDAQGRVLLPVRLRVSATMVGDVDVLGQYNWLEVWNHERFLSKLQSEPYSEDDARALAEYGI
jgi:transcriptional regulator MraZ